MKHAFDSIVKQIIDDSLDRSEKKAAPTIIACFSCGRSMVYHGPSPDGTSGRFCSERCREWFDAGNPPYAPIDYGKLCASTYRHVAGPAPGYIPKPLRMAGRWGEPGRGWYTECAGCGKEFESKGLRSCSTECERRCRDREQNTKDMAAAGMTADAKRRCLECGAVIPRWRNGKRVRSDAQFCCARHKTKYLHRKAVNGVKTQQLASEGQSTFCDTDNAKKVPILRGQKTGVEKSVAPIFGPDTPPLNVVGGYRFPSCPQREAPVMTEKKHDRGPVDALEGCDTPAT